MERAEERDRTPPADSGSDDEPSSAGRHVAQLHPVGALEPVLPYAPDAVEADGLPVMARLSQVLAQVGQLTDTVDHLNATIARLERTVAEKSFAAGHWNSKTVPRGITARPNPMTRSLTPLSAAQFSDNGREEALATVRTLFEPRRVPWWQKLPGLQRG